LNDECNIETSHSVFEDFLQGEIEKYLQPPLICSLVDLFASICCLDFIFEDQSTV